MAFNAATEHSYAVSVVWTGNTGAGTASYRGYQRSHEVSVRGKPTLLGSSDPEFLGDPARYNPEEMLVASISSCHMLWYLHLCCVEGIVVTSYEDLAEGVMVVAPDGGGRFSQVVLQPEIRLAPGADQTRARALHGEAQAKCFIANSVNFPIRHEPVFLNA